MPDYRRYYQPNAWVFITGVTRDRIPYLQAPETMQIVWAAVRRAQRIYSFELPAYVFMPDHFHWLLRLKEGELDFSRIVHSIKWWSSIQYKQRHSVKISFSLWQPRFWDHMIRDLPDFERHLDYIHWNPVKHQLAGKPEAWNESSYPRWLEQGFYERGWGWSGEPDGLSTMNLE